MKLYAVNVQIETELDVVVLAENENQAWNIASEGYRDYLDIAEEDVTIRVRVEVNADEDDLPPGWDGSEIPLGGDGKTSISEIISGQREAEDETQQDLFTKP